MADLPEMPPDPRVPPEGAIVPSGGGAPSQQAIGNIFRQQELQRRAVRRARLLNEAALEMEPLTAQEKTIDTLAKESLKRQDEEFKKATEFPWPMEQPSYWKRLWLAILGR